MKQDKIVRSQSKLVFGVVVFLFYLSFLCPTCYAADSNGLDVIMSKVFKSETPPAGVTPSVIECEIQMQERVYQYGKPVEFEYVCSTLQGDHFEIPNGLIYHLGFGDGIILQNEQGKEFRFLKLPLASLALFPDVKFKNGSVIAKYLINPGLNNGLIERGKWIDTWNDTTLTLKQKSALYQEGMKTIPVGKYKVWLDVDYTWGENFSSAYDQFLKPRSVDLKALPWWHLRGKPVQSSFEVTN